MNIQITRNSSPLRTGLYYLAILVGVALTILLVACPAASSDNNGGASDTVSVRLTDAATDGITISVPDAVTMEGDTTLWWAVFEEGTTLTDDATLTAVMNVQAAIPTGTVTPTGGTEGPAMLFGSSGAAGVAIGTVPTNSSNYPDIMGTLTTVLMADTKYDVFIVIGTGTEGRLLPKQNITAVLSTAPMPTCDANDATADCDDDTVVNGMDAFPDNACAGMDSDNDGHPDMLAAVSTATGCTAEKRAELTGMTIVGDVTLQTDNCMAVSNPAQEDANTSTAATEVGIGDACDTDVDDDDDGLIEIWHLDALNNIRNDFDGSHYDTATAGGTDFAAANETDGSNTGCASNVCNGYELMRSFDFAQHSDYANGTINLDWRPTTGSGDARMVVAPASADNAGWQPLAHDTGVGTAGHQGPVFAATLDGNGNTIANLYVSRDREQGVGFIGAIADSSIVHHLGLRAAFVEGNASQTGGLVGDNSGTISAAWVDATSSIKGAQTGNGGLVGRNNSGATIVASYSNASVLIARTAGGLVGSNTGTISASYSNGIVVASTNLQLEIGGLIGANDGTVGASWSATLITLSSPQLQSIGGLIGLNQLGAVATSYWNKDDRPLDSATVAGRLFGIGSEDVDVDNHVDVDESGTGTDADTDNDGNISPAAETNTLEAQGLTTAQMRASTGTFPDFSSVADLVGATDPALTGNFSGATDPWQITAGCYPRLRTWMDDGTDNMLGTADDTYSAILLPGQGTPTDMDGLCTP